MALMHTATVGASYSLLLRIRPLLSHLAYLSLKILDPTLY